MNAVDFFLKKHDFTDYLFFFFNFLKTKASLKSKTLKKPFIALSGQIANMYKKKMSITDISSKTTPTTKQSPSGRYNRTISLNPNNLPSTKELLRFKEHADNNNAKSPLPHQTNKTIYSISEVKTQMTRTSSRTNNQQLTSSSSNHRASSPSMNHTNEGCLSPAEMLGNNGRENEETEIIENSDELGRNFNRDRGKTVKYLETLT